MNRKSWVFLELYIYIYIYIYRRLIHFHAIWSLNLFNLSPHPCPWYPAKGSVGRSIESRGLWEPGSAGVKPEWFELKCEQKSVQSFYKMTKCLFVNLYPGKIFVKKTLAFGAFARNSCTPTLIASRGEVIEGTGGADWCSLSPSLHFHISFICEVYIYACMNTNVLLIYTSPFPIPLNRASWALSQKFWRICQSQLR